MDGIKQCVGPGKFGGENLYDPLEKGAGEWEGGYSDGLLKSWG